MELLSKEELWRALQMPDFKWCHNCVGNETHDGRNCGRAASMQHPCISPTGNQDRPTLWEWDGKTK